MFAPAWPIETERLTLRPFEAGDLDAFHEMHSDPGVVRWLRNDARTLEESMAVGWKLLARLPAGELTRLSDAQIEEHLAASMRDTGPSPAPAISGGI